MYKILINHTLAHVIFISSEEQAKRESFFFFFCFFFWCVQRNTQILASSHAKRSSVFSVHLYKSNANTITKTNEEIRKFGNFISDNMCVRAIFFLIFLLIIKVNAGVVRPCTYTSNQISQVHIEKERKTKSTKYRLTVRGADYFATPIRLTWRKMKKAVHFNNGCINNTMNAVRKKRFTHPHIRTIQQFYCFLRVSPHSTFYFIFFLLLKMAR